GSGEAVAQSRMSCQRISTMSHKAQARAALPRRHNRYEKMPADTAIDPVCGMTVKTSTHLRTDYKGDAYYFCAPGCLAKFRADPQRFLRPQHAATPTAADLDAIYTCPMHPEVRQKGPGACPICGMALERAMVTLDEGPNPELVDMSRRLWIAI